MCMGIYIHTYIFMSGAFCVLLFDCIAHSHLPLGLLLILDVIYIYIYICIYIYTYTCVYICICDVIYIYIHIYIWAGHSVYCYLIAVHTHPCLWAYWSYVTWCIHAYMYISIYIYDLYLCIDMHMCVCVYIYTCIYIYERGILCTAIWLKCTLTLAFGPTPYIWRDSFICNMPHKWRDSFICKTTDTWLIRMWHARFQCTLTLAFGPTAHLWRHSFICLCHSTHWCVTWLILPLPCHRSVMSHMNESRHIRDVSHRVHTHFVAVHTHPCLGSYCSFVTWLIHIWHDSFCPQPSECNVCDAQHPSVVCDAQHASVRAPAPLSAVRRAGTGCCYSRVDAPIGIRIYEAWSLATRTPSSGEKLRIVRFWCVEFGAADFVSGDQSEQGGSGREMVFGSGWNSLEVFLQAYIKWQTASSGSQCCRA